MHGISSEQLRALKEFDTALLANTIGYIDPTPAHEYYMAGTIQSVTPALGPTVGIAYTCEMDTSTPEGDADMDLYWRQLEEIDREELPVLWVVKTVGDRPDHECVLGDGMAKTLHAAGCIGAVTDGGVRDVVGLLTIPFAAYCRLKTIHHTNMRVRSVGQPVHLGGITIRTGDVLHADSGGVIRVPRGSIDALPGKAIRMLAFERDAHLLLRRADLTPAQKRDRVGAMLRDYGFSS